MADEAGARRDLVVIGASAGGVEVLRRVVGDLPEDLKAAVCIVLHIAPSSPSALSAILQRASRLSCHPAEDGQSLRAGEILVASPDRHLVVVDDHVTLTLGPRENGHRPAIDPLFRSAAQARGRRVVGVILSGTRDDGSAGLAAIKAAGGAAVVQDPDEALYAGMPASALAHASVDAVAPSSLVASTIVAMVNGEDLPPGTRPSTVPEDSDPPGKRATTVCPECGGVLGEHLDAGVTQWRCRVGHRYSPDSLADAQAEDVEAAVWAAVRALEDRCALLTRMAEQAERRGQPRSARSFRHRAESAAEHAQQVRGALGQAAASTLRSAEHARPAPGAEGSTQESAA